MDDIKVIKNFLSKEECNMLIKEAEAANTWSIKSQNDMVKMYKSSNHALIIDINKRVASIFSKDLHTQIIQFVYKTDSDSVWEKHMDTDQEITGVIFFGVVIYLNEDFVGGLLEYPDLDFAVKPEPGLLVYHASNIQHQVSPVISGNRYTLTSFIRKLKSK
jgi:predicted 2-oxoglutarate/Fe(II)-dependent dioxygenase YbiX